MATLYRKMEGSKEEGYELPTVQWVHDSRFFR